MKKSRNISLVIGGIIIAAGIILLLVFMVKANNKRRSAETLAQIQLLEKEVEYYKNISETTTQRLLDCQDLFIILKKNDNKEAEKLASKPAAAPKAPAPKAPAPVPAPKAPAPVPVPVQPTPIASVAVDPGVTATPEVAGFDALKDINGNILFCVMANNHGGLHFPQKALDLGVKIQGTQSNHTGDGTNFVIRQALDKMEGDYGLTKNGKMFVSNRLIETTLSKLRIPLNGVALKGTFTGWSPREMEREGDYWILQVL